MPPRVAEPATRDCAVSHTSAAASSAALFNRAHTAPCDRCHNQFGEATLLSLARLPRVDRYGVAHSSEYPDMTVLKVDGQRYLEEMDSRTRAGDDGPVGRCGHDPDGLRHDSLPDAAVRRWRFAQMQTLWGRCHACRVGLTEAGVLLVSATRYLLSGVLDGDPIRVCALGNLTSTTDANSQFIPKFVEDVVADAIVRHSSGVALLFCGAVDPWHNDAGYQNIAPPDVELVFPPTPRAGAPMVSLRAGEHGDLPAIVGMGQSRSITFRFHLDRDVDFITHGIVRERLRAGVGPAGMQELQFFVTEEGTIATAYVVMRVRGDAWTVLQCGDRDPSGARVGAIMQALIARDPATSSPVIRGWFPHGFTPPQATRISETPSSLTLMARLLGSHRQDLPLCAENSLYWMGDLF
jgi:hypothetical protein